MRLVGSPRSEADLVECLLNSSRDDLILPRGIGSMGVIAIGGQRSAAVISLEAMNQIARLERDDFYVSCAAGMSLSELQSTLAKHGLQFPFLAAGQSGTVGGMVARGQIVSSTGCFNIARWVLATKVLLADGSISKSGAITYKSVAGYDLPKLFCGSFGTLGIIVEASLRLYPKQARAYGKDLAPARPRVPKLADRVQHSVDSPKVEVIASRIKKEFDPDGRFPAITGWNAS